MPTSSIFANFNIDDKDAAERFVLALEESAKSNEGKEYIPTQVPLTNREDIRALWIKRKSMQSTNHIDTHSKGKYNSFRGIPPHYQ